MNYTTITTKEDYDSLIEGNENHIHSIRVVIFGSNKECKSQEDSRIRSEDFDESNIILKITPIFKHGRIQINDIIISGKVISYKLLGLIVTFKIGEHKYHALCQEYYSVISENRNFIFKIDVHIHNLY